MAGAVTQLYSILGPYGDSFITKQGSLVMGIELGGICPDAVHAQEAKINSRLFEIAFSAFPSGYTVTQAYIHTDGHGIKISTENTKLPIVRKLVQDRDKALNQRKLSQVRLVYLIEAPDPNQINSSFVKACFHSIKSFANPEVINVLKAKLKDPSSTILERDELDERYNELQQVTSLFMERIEKYSIVKKLNIDELFRYSKYLATGNAEYIADGSKIKCPDASGYLDTCMADGDISPSEIKYTPVLKLDAVEPVFCRVATAHGFPQNLDNVWIKRDAPVLETPGNYVLLTTFTILTEVQKKVRLLAKELEIKRDSIKVSDLLSHNRNKEVPKHLQDKLDALRDAEEYDERGVNASLSVIVFDADPKRFFKTCTKLQSRLGHIGFSIGWETQALRIAYKYCQVGGYEHNYKKQFSYLSSAAEMCLKYRANNGRSRIELAVGDQVGPAYVFETRSGSPFAFHPFSQDRQFLIGNGPTRSGKSFLRQTLASHMLKFGTYIDAVDIDPGAETLAYLLGDKGGVFRGEQGSALNPFSHADRVSNTQFSSHFLGLIRLLLESNEAKDAQSINTQEQNQIDEKLKNIFDLDVKSNRSLGVFIELLDVHLHAKLSRWISPGVYHGIFDAVTDSLGGMDKQYSAYNLQSFRDTPAILRPFLWELFFRITNKYENTLPTDVPKILDIDEAHHALSIPAFADFIVSKIRTWGKFNAGIFMWSQSPEEFKNVQNWAAVRSAVTTLMFFADPEADYSLYAETYQLSTSQIDTIRSLRRNKEVLIIQPHEGICQVGQLNVEPAQHVANTSNPRERMIRDQLIETHGVDEGFKLAIDKIMTPQKEQTEYV
jgi:type IV secretion system protein VirB4